MKKILFSEVKKILLGEPVTNILARALRYILIAILNFFPQSVVNAISNRVWQDKSAQTWLASKICSMSPNDVSIRHGFIREFMETADYRRGAHVIEFGAGTPDIARLVRDCDQKVRISGVNLTPCALYASYGDHIVGSVGDTLRLITECDVSLFISLGSLMYVTGHELNEVFLCLKKRGASILLLEPHVTTRFGLRPNPFCFNHNYISLLQGAGFSIRRSEVVGSDARTKLICLVATPAIP